MKQEEVMVMLPKIWICSLTNRNKLKRLNWIFGYVSCGKPHISKISNKFNKLRYSLISTIHMWEQKYLNCGRPFKMKYEHKIPIIRISES